VARRLASLGSRVIVWAVSCLFKLSNRPTSAAIVVPTLL